MVVCEPITINEQETEILYNPKDSLYTISEFIDLLETAKEKWGDKEILVHDSNENIAGGFLGIYLQKGTSYHDSVRGETIEIPDTVNIYT